MKRTIRLAGGMEATIGNPERSEFSDNLSGAIQYALAKVAVFVLDTLGEGLGAMFGSGLVAFLERIEPHLVEYYSPLIEQIKQLEGIPDWFTEFLDKMQDPEHEAGAAVLNQVVGSAVGGVTGSLLGALLAPVTYGAMDLIRPARPGPADAFAMRWREEIDHATLDDWLSDQGWPAIAIDAYREIIRPRSGIGDLIAWAWRVHQDPEAAREEIEKRGYPEEDIDRAMLLSKALPGPGDLVRFALREVWREDLRPELLDPDAPDLYYELMKKQGYDRERAADYWASHWQLPSPGQGVEMFWRLPDFTEADLRALLTRLDILPRYHDQLIAIAYSPLTRVDIRRMNATGQIPDEELPTHYGNVGFSPDDAQLMADFTIAYNRSTDDEYTKTEILQGFREGMLKFEVAKQLLVDMGKSEDYAEYVLALELYKRIKKLVAERVKLVKLLYIEGELDRTGAAMRLAALNLEPDRIDLYLEEWDIAKRIDFALPTLARIEEWYKEAVLDEETARKELTKRRYRDYAIDWFIQDWDTQKVEEARLEAERAQKEEERIEKAKFRDERLVALAHLNAKIATLRVLIAEWKVLIYQITKGSSVVVLEREKADLYKLLWEAPTAGEREAIEAQIEAVVVQLDALEDQAIVLKENIVLAQEEIARLQLEKAELPVVLS